MLLGRAMLCILQHFLSTDEEHLSTQTSENVTWLTQEAYNQLKAELEYLSGPARYGDRPSRSRRPARRVTSGRTAGTTRPRRSRARWSCGSAS
ncbi:hypothetical protein SMICM304S_00097 [Streptomyces microflavus]